MISVLKSSLSRLFSISLVAVLIISASIRSQTKPKTDCEEYITIDSAEYKLPQRWCGKKLSDSELAVTKNLVKLDSGLTFEDYRIYVTKETKEALGKMSSAAKKDSIKLIVDSGFRSVWYQKQIVRRRLKEGEKFENIISFVAPPGYSEHHTGRAVDFVPSEARFAHTKIYNWLKSNAAGFGFYETLPEDTTGTIPWESWHWVYKPNK